MARNQLLLIGEELPQITALKDAFKKNNLEVAVDVADSVIEASIVINAKSPLVVISTDIMMLLKVMMQDHKYMREKSTKTILFNAKGDLPQQVMDKLNHCGLTGHLTTEDPDRTLYYKTTLYLKSLPQPEADDVLYDGNSSYDPKENQKKVAYIKGVEKNEEGEVQFSTENGLVDATVLAEFCDESTTVLNKMEEVIAQIEDEEIPFEDLKKFSDHVGGIMGTSSVLGLEGISKFCLLTKSIADHILLYDQKEIRDVVVGVLGDSTSFLTSLMEEIREGDESTLKNIGKEGFIKRLHWLSEKFQITQEQLKENDGEESALGQDSIDDILESLNANEV